MFKLLYSLWINCLSLSSCLIFLPISILDWALCSSFPVLIICKMQFFSSSLPSFTISLATAGPSEIWRTLEWCSWSSCYTFSLIYFSSSFFTSICNFSASASLSFLLIPRSWLYRYLANVTDSKRSLVTGTSNMHPWLKITSLSILSASIENPFSGALFPWERDAMVLYSVQNSV